MTNNPTGLLLVFGVVAAALGSVPLAVVTFTASRWVRPFSRAFTYALAGVGGLVALLAVGVALISPEAGVVVALVAVLLTGILWAVPLLVARAVLTRRGVAPERALRAGVAGLPPALLAALPVAFGDFSRYNITFLTGIEAVIAWTTLAVVVLFGPTVVALVVVRIRG